MMFYVVKTVRVHSSVRHIARSVVKDVPARTSAKTVAEAVEEAGYAPIEMGIVWANHSVKDAAKLKDVQLGIENEWTWEDLLALVARPVLRQLNVRIPNSLYAQCEVAAANAGTSLQGWVQKTLALAVQPQ